MVLKIKELVGEYCSQRTDFAGKKGGEAIRAMINQAWATEAKIIISFDGVKLATPSFLDEAIGKLVFDHSLEEMRDKLDFTGYDDQTKEKINKSIQLRMVGSAEMPLQKT